MNFDITALNAFRNFNGANDAAIANVNAQTGKVSQNDTYRGGFIGLFRVKKTEDNNDALRPVTLQIDPVRFG